MRADCLQATAASVPAVEGRREGVGMAAAEPSRERYPAGAARTLYHVAASVGYGALIAIACTILHTVVSTLAMPHMAYQAAAAMGCPSEYVLIANIALGTVLRLLVVALGIATATLYVLAWRLGSDGQAARGSGAGTGR
jgi:hypothetical protein